MNPYRRKVFVCEHCGLPTETKYEKASQVHKACVKARAAERNKRGDVAWKRWLAELDEILANFDQTEKPE